MKKLKTIIPLLIEEIAHILLWCCMMLRYPERFSSNHGTVVVISLGLAILLANLFDLLGKRLLDKYHSGSSGMRVLAFLVRLVVIAFIFWLACQCAFNLAPADIGLLILFGSMAAVAYIGVSYGISVLLQIDGNTLRELRRIFKTKPDPDPTMTDEKDTR